MMAGKLRHRVTLQSATETTGTFGDVTQTWADVGTFWAKVEVKSGKEANESDRPKATLTYQVTMRAGVDISPAMRFVWGTKVLQVQTAALDVLSTYWEILCTEVVL